MIGSNEVVVSTHLNYWLIAFLMLVAVATVVLIAAAARGEFTEPDKPWRVAVVGVAVALVAGFVMPTTIFMTRDDWEVGVFHLVPSSRFSDVMDHDFGLRRVDGSSTTFINTSGQHVHCDVNARSLSHDRAALSVSCGSAITPKHASH